MGAGAKANFSFRQCIQDYTAPGTDERKGCEAFATGAALNRNDPEGKRELRGVVAAFRKIASAIERDGALLKL